MTQSIKLNLKNSFLSFKVLLLVYKSIHFSKEAVFIIYNVIDFTSMQVEKKWIILFISLFQYKTKYIKRVYLYFGTSTGHPERIPYSWPCATSKGREIDERQFYKFFFSFKKVSIQKFFFRLEI